MLFNSETGNEVIERGLSRFLEQDKEKLKLQMVFSAFLSQFQSLHDAIKDVAQDVVLVNAVGKVLDRWGVQFDVERGDKSDEEYRKAIFIQIFIDHSTGTVSDILNSIYMLYLPISVSIKEYDGFVELGVNKPINSLSGVNNLLSFIVASGVNYSVNEEFEDSFDFAECTTERVNFIAKDNEEETELNVLQTVSAEYKLQVEADKLAYDLDSLGLAEIILTSTDYSIEGGGFLAEGVKND